MKTARSMAVAVVLVVALLAMGAGDTTGESDESVARLSARIRSLERRVDDLEKRLRGKAPTVRPSIRRSSRPSGDRSLPRGWQRREFNGVPYYVIPVENRPGRSRRQDSRRDQR
jgi:hypothetical protein